eukprot:GHVU01038162.1.p1 GENE.GHVU01038162.1~~GHVU01038162.1.p1  ORF type:complete len:331 (-),score=37.04 GHVU01038162.1:1490-2482(-)
MGNSSCCRKKREDTKQPPVDYDDDDEQEAEGFELDAEEEKTAWKSSTAYVCSKQLGRDLGSLFAYTDGLDVFLILVGVFSSIVTGTAMPFFTAFWGDMIDDIFKGNWEDVDYVSGAYGMFALAIILFCSGLMQVGVLETTADRQCNRIKLSYFRALLRQDMSFYDDRDSQEYAATVVGQVGRIREAIGMKFGQCFQYTFTFIVGYLLSFMRNWELSLVICFAMPLVAIGGLFQMWVMTSMAREASQAYEGAEEVGDETYSSFKTVVAFGGEQKMADRFEKQLRIAEKAGSRGALWSGVGLGMSYFSAHIAFAVGMFYGGTLAVEQLDFGK